MPLFNQAGTPVAPPPGVAPVPVVETASVYQNTNTRVQIEPHIDGNTWTVDYYGKFIGDDEILTLDPDTHDNSLVSYQLVHDMELRVTDPLTQTTDPLTSLTTVTGAANMYSIVIPIVGDVFVAALGDGTYGKFALTSVERQSIYKETAWVVQYTLEAYATEAVLTDLNDRVVITLYFDLKGLQEAGGALATESEYQRKILRKKYIADMIDRYYEEFYNPLIKTFVLPDALYKIYDPYVVEFWNYLIGKEQSDGKPRPHEFDIRGAIFKTDYVTVWDAFRKQSISVLNRAVHSMQNVSTLGFSVPYVQFTLHSSGLTYVVHPKEVGGLVLTGGTDLLVDPLPPYIFSSAFYTNAATGQSVLEMQVHKAIAGEILAFSDLKPLYEGIGALTNVQRFYQIPFLIALFTLSR